MCSADDITFEEIRPHMDLTVGLEGYMMYQEEYSGNMIVEVYDGMVNDKRIVEELKDYDVFIKDEDSKTVLYIKRKDGVPLCVREKYQEFMRISKDFRRIEKEFEIICRENQVIL